MTEASTAFQSGSASVGQASRLDLVRALFPDLAAEVDGAAARFAPPGRDEAFDAKLDAAAAALMPHAAFSDVADTEGARRAERSFAAARAACTWLDLELPQPEAFVESGADLAGLGQELARDAELWAVPTPFGLGAERWRAAYVRAAETVAALAPSASGESPLVLAAEAEREFKLLDTPPAGVPAVNSGGAAWTLRLVPAGERPPVLGLGFAHGPHVTLPEMLMLQLMRVASGVAPVDSASFTWLDGALAEGRLAARHVYDESELAIRITCREIGNQGPHLGARTPLLGESSSATPRR
ncbi:hypothetical protein ACFWHR_12540 [Leucobacter sp. NPDC058333]|uniref:hypothetical protein n=1 Tax=Leucobacter sp. NPDC058333 TaxID=3346450 RepID=UPI0036674BBB